MIVRAWTARAAPDRAPAYAEHLRGHVLPTLGGIDGYAGAMLWQREAADESEIVVVTFWRSLDAVKRFAGANPEIAVVADEAAELLTGFDDRVRHYELILRDDPGSRG